MAAGAADSGTGLHPSSMSESSEKETAAADKKNGAGMKDSGNRASAGSMVSADAAARNRHGMYVLYRKELADHLHSVRFQILYAMLFIISLVSLSGAIQTLGQAALQTSDGQTTLNSYLFLLLFTTSGSNIYSFSTFIGFLGPIVGIMLGFDAINEEVAQGTLNRLAAQPIYRDTIINAKFLAGATAILITVYSIGGIMAGIGMITTGLVPSGEEVARLLLFLLMAVLYMCMWMAIAEFFSVVCRHAATSALACIAIWLFLTLFQSLVASGIAGLIYPTTGGGLAAAMNVVHYYQLNTALNRISPYYLFSEMTTILMNPNVHSTNVVSILQSQEGAVASYLTLGQSMLQIWPHIVAMFAVAVAAFAAAYIAFMRREIRA